MEYIQGHPDFNFHPDIDELFEAQAKQIHKYFWENNRLSYLENGQIAQAVYDLHIVMERNEVEDVLNAAINKFHNWDGIFKAPLGSLAMIDILNRITDDDVERFLSILKNLQKIR
jgi:hypothetical protein